MNTTSTVKFAAKLSFEPRATMKALDAEDQRYFRQAAEKVELQEYTYEKDGRPISTDDVTLALSQNTSGMVNVYADDGIISKSLGGSKMKIQDMKYEDMVILLNNAKNWIREQSLGA